MSCCKGFSRYISCCGFNVPIILQQEPPIVELYSTPLRCNYSAVQLCEITGYCSRWASKFKHVVILQLSLQYSNAVSVCSYRLQCGAVHSACLLNLNILLVHFNFSILFLISNVFLLTVWRIFLIFLMHPNKPLDNIG